MGTKPVTGMLNNDEASWLREAGDFEKITGQIKALLDQQTQAPPSTVPATEFTQRVAQCHQLLEQLRTIHHRVSEDAIRDGLTGLYNRRHFDHAVQQQIHLAQKQHLPLSMLMVDLDTFGQINKRHGHEMGDRILKLAARCIKNATRDSDLVFRYGGEEFAIVLPASGPEGARIAANRILHALPRVTQNIRQGNRAEEHLAALVNERDISGSIGIFSVVLPHPQVQTIVHLLNPADRAARLAKHKGRNRLYEAHLLETGLIRFELLAVGPEVRLPERPEKTRLPKPTASRYPANYLISGN